MSRQHAQSEPIAIIGSGCRFPGSCHSPSQLWEFLRRPRDIRSTIPTDRFSAEGFYHVDGSHHGTSNVKQGYFLEQNVRHFDASFFSVRPVEANAIDPQQRLLLEVVYESLECAGLDMHKLQGSDTAVYVGLMCGDYEHMLMRDLDTIPMYHATGTGRSIMSNRISYFFDWTGPSMTIDTACSSSLIAVHQAVQLLRSGDSRMAIAAGSNLLLGPEHFIGESKLKMLSPTGRSQMWDVGADGYARGEGICAVVLKTLSAALADGDHIECIIRETGINQDGRTKGLTMPSATAQAALIRSTYKKTGLDPQRSIDRPQYFEAHGTGTPAGDPLEAEAIHAAFFENSENQTRSPTYTDRMFVGSVKTVIGHTEGTAGLAGILKVSLALQNEQIPPNLHFRKLNPSIEPFYQNLQIPNQAQRWPKTAVNGLRRASVNCFGFGGANSHAILESYHPPTHDSLALKGVQLQSVLQDSPKLSLSHHRPFVFSAYSASSLKLTLQSYYTYLRSHPGTDLCRMEFTLQKKRTDLPYKVCVVASDQAQLCTRLQSTINQLDTPSTSVTQTKDTGTSPKRLLGIFTGQGAQWAQMGRTLILESKHTRERFSQLEATLDSLPETQRPTWSLLEELLRTPDNSRINEAELSQPLCTAVQVILVDLLKDVGIDFTAVVGHSSGEIAAAYVAGYISSAEALKIAYFRGFYSHLSQGIKGQSGAMLAAGTGFADALDLCELPFFDGRLTVAASNSSNSTTLSGDEEAVLHAKIVLEDESKFARRLLVTKAYHSHHMFPCSDSYQQSISSIKMQRNEDSKSSCTWYSSVHPKLTGEELKSVSETYWTDNMTRPVLFVDALRATLDHEPTIDGVIEIGPHPALKGPVLQTIKEVYGKELPYISLLKRGIDSFESVATALGELWKHFGRASVDWTGYHLCLDSYQERNTIRDLPTYSWNHEREYWHESRSSAQFRTRTVSSHILLGDLLPHSTSEHTQWRNILKPSEISWLDGHRLQGQMVFPAAGYISTAIEAGLQLAGGKKTLSITISDFVIDQAMIFDNEDSAVEIVFSCMNIQYDAADEMSFRFTFSSAPWNSSTDLSTMAHGHVHMSFDGPAILTRKSSGEQNLIDVDVDRFYTSLEDLGYGYTGHFRALSNLQRKLGYAIGHVRDPPKKSTDDLTVHPAMLDATIQSLILAFSYPRDGRLWGLHVPVSMERLTIDLPGFENSKCGRELDFQAHIHENGRSGVQGDVNLFVSSSEPGILQIEGLRCVPFSAATEAEDSNIYTKIEWNLLEPNCSGKAFAWRSTAEEYELASILERVSYFYIRRLNGEIPIDHPSRVSGPHKFLFNWILHIINSVTDGKQKHTDVAWNNDTLEDITQASAKFANCIDLKVARVVGEQMRRVILGETTILEHLMPDGLLTEYYKSAMSFIPYGKHLCNVVSQVVQRYPKKLRILEVGAGTGSATRKIFSTIGDNFLSYAYTDVSVGFFPAAEKEFEKYNHKMSFKVLDLETDPTAQGFANQSFDIVVANMVLHATSNLTTTLSNLRRLLRPGGYLIFMEATNPSLIRGGHIFGSLPGWWVGAEDGRILSPCITKPEWDVLLRNCGFGGIDASTPDLDPFPAPASVVAAQAVDEQIITLRDPLHAPMKPSLDTKDLFVLVPASTTSRIPVEETVRLLLPYYVSITTIRWPQELHKGTIPSRATILSLCDIEDPCFENLDQTKFEALKMVFGARNTILWVTRGCKADKPFANMTLGFIRCQQWENPDIKTQFLNIEDEAAPDATFIAEALLRFDIAVNLDKTTRQRLLLTIEPELLIENGVYQIPRLVADIDQNLRFNSTRRSISQSVDAGVSCVRLAITESKYFLESIEKPVQQPTERASLSLISMYTALTPLQFLHNEPLYVVVGKPKGGNQHMLGFSSNNASITSLEHEVAFTCSAEVACHKTLVLDLVETMAAMILAQHAQSCTSIVLHEPSPLFVETARRLVQHLSVKLIVVQADPTSETSIHINRHTTSKAILSKLGASHSIFLSYSHSTQTRETARRIGSILSPHCLKLTMYNDITGFTKLFQLCFMEPTQILKTALEIMGDSKSTVMNEAKSIVPIHDLSGTTIKPRDAQTVVDWTNSKAVPTDVQPCDTRVDFDPQATYWLVGLVQGLGASLCEWMVSRGARYIVLSSRRAPIDHSLVEKLARHGAVIEYIKCDVTSRESVQAAHKDIMARLPSIKGVAQGAMVLQDCLVRDMTFEIMQKVLQPKVQGSIHLDELFRTQPLEFFVFFSSMASVVGNAGQANYSAANMFMVTLAAQRRQLGLAGSVINLGAVLGAGYVTRQQNVLLEDNLRLFGHNWLSEKAVHQIFAEAIISGRPESSHSGEISTGLRYIPEDHIDKPLWTENPQFAYQIIPKLLTNDTVGFGKQSSSIQQQLEVAGSAEAVTEIVKQHFISKLNSSMQLNLSASDPKTGEIRTDSLGIDSLMAVDIRTWFSKHLNVNVPVLKILSGSSIDDLLEYAIENLPAKAVVVMPSPQEVDSQRTRESDPGTSLPTTEEPSVDIASDDHRSDSPFSSSDSLDDHPTPFTQASSVNAAAKFYELSASQSLYYFIHTYLNDKTTLNHTGLLKIVGRLDISRLRAAVPLVAQRHDALSTRFLLDDAQRPRQQIMEHSNVALETFTIADETGALDEFERMKRHIFDLTHGEIMRVMLLSCPKAHYLIIGCHHINIDFVSMQLYIRDLEVAYTSGKLPNDALQYLDYVEELSTKHSTNSVDLRFWTQKFRSIPEPLSLPSLARSKTRTTLRDYHVHKATHVIDASTMTSIRGLCKRHGFTPFHFYLAVFQTALLRVWNVEDICIGIADSNRKDERSMDCIGPLMNLLPLRFKLDKNETFLEALKTTKHEVLSTLAHSSTPFHELLDHLRVPRSASHSPLFQAFVDYRQAESQKQAFEGCTMSLTKFELGRAAYDISLDIVDDGPQCYFTIMLQQQIFDLEAAPILLSCFANLINTFATHETWTLERPVLYRDEDYARIIAISSGPRHESMWPATVVHQIFNMCDQHVNEIALQDRDQKLTYIQMQDTILSIAGQLYALGINRGDRILVYQEPSALLVCSMLAVMTVGAVYVPVDILSTMGRLRSIIEDCNPALILVDTQSESRIDFQDTTRARTIDIASIVVSNDERPLIYCTRSDAAAIFYTSGSTGTPKGVILTHDNLCNELEGSQLAYGFSQEVVLQQSAVSFDMSITQIFTAVAFGGSLVIAPLSARGDPRSITAIIQRDSITFTGATPSEYLSWMQYGESLQGSSWRIAISGGELLPGQLLASLQALDLATNLHFFNAYGPTEATCSVTKTEPLLGRDISSITAGKPCANNQVYICDENLQILPLGMSGEIVIGGRSVAEGYLNDVVDGKFVANTIHNIGQPTEKLYRTGDCGKWLPNGSLIVEGRLDGDTQVKVRGQRMDVREIEQAITVAASGSVQKVVVTTRRLDSTTEQILVAHMVLSPEARRVGQESAVYQIKSSLDLPQYMWPSVFETTTDLPLTQVGKIDRKAIANLPLDDIEIRQANKARVANLKEQKVYELWTRVIPNVVLDKHGVDSETDFFHVGGNSMSLVALQAHIQTTFHVEVPLVDLFSHSTLSRMAHRIMSDVDQTEVSLIDWEEETEPSLDLDKHIHLEPTSHPDGVQFNVVLTGATGFVGRALVNGLLRQPKIQRIYCIAVRDQAKGANLPADPRVEVYHGDLGEPSLGLSPKHAEEIFEHASIVIHNGSDVSHLKSYRTLKRANVGSTVELFKLCLPRRIPIHYISTAGVTFYSKSNCIGEESAANFAPPVDGTDGYTATKWASERYLEKAAARFKLPLTIHRPSSIIREDNDDESMDIMQNLLKYSRTLGRTPDSRNLRGTLDLVRLDSVTKWILQEVLAESHDEGPIKYMNLTGDEVIPLISFAKNLSGRDDKTYDVLSMREWTQRAAKAGMPPALVAFFNSVDEGNEVFFPSFKRHGAV